MQPSHYSTCLYGHEGWATPARHAQSVHDCVDIDFRFKECRSGAGNSYVASRGLRMAAMLEVPQRTCRTAADALNAHAQSYDDVISGVYSEAVQSGAVIARRNERERNRVKTINQTFARLRQHLPSSAAASVIKPTTHSSVSGSTVMKAKKLSKVQILRAAIHYIGQLQQLLMTSDDDDDDDSLSRPIISDAEYNRKINLQTPYDSVNSTRIKSAGAENSCLDRTDCSTTTNIKRKTMYLVPNVVA